MDMSFDVQVLDRDDKPVSGAKVEAFFPGIIKGGSQVEFCDADGHALFECTMTHPSVIFHCRGHRFGSYDLDDGASFTLNLP